MIDVCGGWAWLCGAQGRLCGTRVKLCGTLDGLCATQTLYVLSKEKPLDESSGLILWIKNPARVVCLG